jgi:CRP/FNR family transcriptional regulator, cyclic AMP receptor protein
MATDLLGSVPLFSKLPEADRNELTEMLRARQFPANQPVVWIGEQGDDFYVIQSGKVSVSCPDESGKEVILASLGPGHFFGELSLLDGGPRTATVRTLNDTTLLSLGREQFLKFLEKHPLAAIHMLTILGQRQRETLDKIRGIKNVNEAVAESQTRWQGVAEGIANITATQWFVMGNILFFALWVSINVVLKKSGKEPFDDPNSFGLLGFIITVEALFISLFVLISQAHQGVRDRIRADLDYQVNLKAHQEVMQLHQKVDRMHTALAQAGGLPARTPAGAGGGQGLATAAREADAG